MQRSHGSIETTRFAHVALARVGVGSCRRDGSVHWRDARGRCGAAGRRIAPRPMARTGGNHVAWRSTDWPFAGAVRATPTHVQNHPRCALCVWLWSDRRARCLPGCCKHIRSFSTLLFTYKMMATSSKRRRQLRKQTWWSSITTATRKQKTLLAVPHSLVELALGRADARLFSQWHFPHLRHLLLEVAGAPLSLDAVLRACPQLQSLRLAVVSCGNVSRTACKCVAQVVA